jgi:hypothetical protein
MKRLLLLRIFNRKQDYIHGHIMRHAWTSEHQVAANVSTLSIMWRFPQLQLSNSQNLETQTECMIPPVI